MIVVPGGVTVQLTATINNIGGARTDVTTSSLWLSSDEAVATVDQSGLVTVLGTSQAGDDRIGMWDWAGINKDPASGFENNTITPASFYTLSGTIDEVYFGHEEWRYWFFVPDWKLNNDVRYNASDVRTEFLPVPATTQPLSGSSPSYVQPFYSAAEKLITQIEYQFPWFIAGTHPETMQSGYFVSIAHLDVSQYLEEFRWQYSDVQTRALVPGDLKAYGPFAVRINFGRSGEGWTTYQQYTFDTPVYIVGRFDSWLA